MRKVAVIGAGIFGASIALELSKKFDVTLYEKYGDILKGASTNNHLRYHYGYHYPRSKQTVLEILNARKSFEKEYGECISKSFPNYYGVSKTRTKTTPENFLKFCKEMNLPYKIEEANENFMNKSRTDLCVRVPESVYDPYILRRITSQKLKNSKVKLKLNCKIFGGEILENTKKLKFANGGKISEENFDFVISAIYSDFNNLNSWFNFQRKKVLYELVELLEVELPTKEKIGLTIIDGEFSSVLPRGERGTFTLGHVKESILKEIVSDELKTELMVSQNVKSNKDGILKKGGEDFPIINKAKFINSIFVTRVVKANVDETDERPTEITEHGNGIYSIFGGKVVTCIETAKKMAEILRQK